MKIVIHSFNYSGNDAGIALVTRNIASRLNHEIHIIAQNINIITKKELPEEEEMHNCHIHRLKRSKIPLLGTMAYFYKVLKKTREINPDVFHEQELCGIGYFVKKYLKKPVLVFAHGIDVFGRQPLLTKILKKLDIKNADVVVSNTIQLGEAIKERFYSREVKLVRNGINLKDFEHEKEKSKSRCVVMTGVGRLMPTKGFQTAIEALGMIKDRIDFRYEIMGTGDYEEELKKLAKEKDIEKNVVFLGQIKHDEVVKNLINSDLLVFPTYHTETCSLVLLEAMASGLPIITTNIQANPELVEEGKGGFLVEPKNPEKLSEKIVEMLSDRKRMLEFGRFNKENAKLFDWSIIAKQMESAYFEAVK